MHSFPYPPVIIERGAQYHTSPLVVLLHGRGAKETDIIDLANALPEGLHYVAVRAPIAEGGGYAWFANQGIGRPIASSLADTMAWFNEWLDEFAPTPRPVVLLGFSGGAAFAGGLVLARPDRYLGAAVLFGTLPFNAGVPTTPGRLQGRHLLVMQGAEDHVIPRELLSATWEYATQESGADVVTHRTPGGHQLTANDVAMLRVWVADVTGSIETA